MHSNKNLTLPQSSPTLSVIVPLLNEAETLPQLFASLKQQQGIDFELILVDGGSSDKSIELATELAATLPVPVQILSAPPGRGCQMNAGAAAAKGRYILFLHTDSTFLSGDALLSGLAGLRAAEGSPAGAAVAARFSLVFAPERSMPPRWRVFHTAKARQNRRGCIHGDQGFLLSRPFFAQVGPFDQTLPFLEDERLSDRIFACGRWILLPARITTSPRRFASEGYWQRDRLNMVILALHQSGYGDWIAGLTTVYPPAPAADKIRLKPALLHIHGQLKRLSRRERQQFWIAIGRCLRDNFWQIRLFLKRGKMEGCTEEDR